MVRFDRYGDPLRHRRLVWSQRNVVAGGRRHTSAHSPGRHVVAGGRRHSTAHPRRLTVGCPWTSAARCGPARAGPRSAPVGACSTSFLQQQPAYGAPADRRDPWVGRHRRGRASSLGRSDGRRRVRGHRHPHPAAGRPGSVNPTGEVRTGTLPRPIQASVTTSAAGAGLRARPAAAAKDEYGAHRAEPTAPSHMAHDIPTSRDAPAPRVRRGLRGARRDAGGSPPPPGPRRRTR